MECGTPASRIQEAEQVKKSVFDTRVWRINGTSMDLCGLRADVQGIFSARVCKHSNDSGCIWGDNSACPDRWAPMLVGTLLPSCTFWRVTYANPHAMSRSISVDALLTTALKRRI